MNPPVVREVDALVLGLGVMGSAAAYHLAKRGYAVVGLDAFEQGHGRGSSHGTSRAIRKAYFQAPGYVPLVERAYAMWRELEDASGLSLLRVNGSVLVGTPESRHISGTIESARLYGLPCESLTSSDLAARFPGFRLHGNLVAVLEPSGGVLHPERCVVAFLNLARAYGAELRHQETVRAWSVQGDRVTVATAQGTYRADRLVIAAGPWSGQVLAELGLPLIVRRVVNVHFSPIRPELYEPSQCPTFAMAVPEGTFYGMPDEIGVKIGRGDVGEACTPDTIRRNVTPDEVAMFRAALELYLPHAAGAHRASLTCMYTMTPDSDFVVDRHPHLPQVAYGCGFSGHGFKFAPVIGEALADLVTVGVTTHPVGFLSAARFLSPPVAA